MSAGPLRDVVASDDRNIVVSLSCGHAINLGAPLGRYANAPAKRRRCWKCQEAAA
jgi:hypothetical protein